MPQGRLALAPAGLPLPLPMPLLALVLVLAMVLLLVMTHVPLPALKPESSGATTKQQLRRRPGGWCALGCRRQPSTAQRCPHSTAAGQMRRRCRLRSGATMSRCTVSRSVRQVCAYSYVCTVCVASCSAAWVPRERLAIPRFLNSPHLHMHYCTLPLHMASFELRCSNRSATRPCSLLTAAKTTTTAPVARALQ